MKRTLVSNCEFVGRVSRIFETPFPGPGQHGGFNRLKGVRKQTRKFNRNGVGNVAHSCTRNRSQNGWPTDCLHPRPARLLKPFFVEPMAPGRLASPLRADWPLPSGPTGLLPPSPTGSLPPEKAVPLFPEFWLSWSSETELFSETEYSLNYFDL